MVNIFFWKFYSNNLSLEKITIHENLDIVNSFKNVEKI